MKAILFTLGYFLFIFGPIFNSVGAWADTILLFSSLLIVAYSIAYGIIIPRYLFAFLWLAPVFFYVAAKAFYFDQADLQSFFHLMLRPFRIYITLIAAFYLTSLTCRNYGSQGFKMAYHFIYYSVFLHALIIIFQLIYPDFKDWVYAYTSTGEFRSTFDYQYRMGGLSGSSGGSVLSVVQSTGILLIPFLTRGATKLSRMIFHCMSLAILVSVFISGRSGIWSIIIFFPLAIILSDNKIKLKTFLKTILSISGFLCILYYLSRFISTLDSASSSFFFSFYRSLDTFINLSLSGEFEDQTTLILANQFIFPDSLNIFLFGDPEHLINTQEFRTLDSDIGYIRNLWSFGIIGMLIFVYPLLKNLLNAFSFRKSIKYSSGLIIGSSVMLFFNSKEGFMYTRMLCSIYSILLACFYIELKALSNKEKSEYTLNKTAKTLS